MAKIEKKKTTPRKPTRTRKTIPLPKSVIRPALEQAAEQIERAKAQQAESKQPRFSIDRKAINDFFTKIYGFTKDAIFSEPKYTADSRKRDQWLAKVVTKEPYLLGVLQSVVAIDKNRGWTLTGGRNQVRRFINILHNFQVAPDVFGWRNGMSVTAQSYYQSDLGSVVEIGRSSPNGPLAALYTVDPSQCKLTGSSTQPLEYTPARVGERLWGLNDYFRVPSFPNPNEKLYGLGFCAVSRCLDLAKLLVSVYEHEREQLGSKAPKGILTINGVTQEQWLQSLEEGNVERAVMEREYYSGVQVLANGDGARDISVALTSLSTTPDEFNREQFVNMIIYGYALAFGYDPREFWPVSSGSLGGARETESQHRRATSKGGLDFALGFQEQIQGELPDSVEFEFEQRDVEGDISEQEFRKVSLDVIKGMYESVNTQGGTLPVEPLITREEARQLLVEANLIPEDWTTPEEDVTSSDTDDGTDIESVDALLEKARVRRAIEKYPNEEIVIYSSKTDKTRIIYNPNAPKRFMIRAIKPAKVEEPKPEPFNVDSFIDEIEKRFTQAVSNIPQPAPPPLPPVIINNPESQSWLSSIMSRIGGKQDHGEANLIALTQAITGLKATMETQRAIGHNQHDRNLQSVADALNNLAVRSQSSQPQSLNVSMPPISVTANIPEQGTPVVNFQPNIQASDVVIREASPVNNIYVEPAPAPVNNVAVTVQPAEVKIPKPIREIQTVARNKAREIESTETEIEYEK